MARGRVCCTSGEDTSKHRAQCMGHRAVHMAYCICCGCNNSHTVSDRAGNHECKAPCTCESKSGDAHTDGSMESGTVPDNTCHRYHDMHGHILADAHKGFCILDPLLVFCKSKHLAGCGRTSVIRGPSPCKHWCTVHHTMSHIDVHNEATSGKALGMQMSLGPGGKEPSESAYTGVWSSQSSLDTCPGILCGTAVCTCVPERIISSGMAWCT